MTPASTQGLLHTKLMRPRLHTALVPRPALFARLDQGLDKSVTLVSAPTGFGKTTLVSAWLAERDLPASWVTLDANDNDPVRFWTYVLSGLRRVDASLGRSALSALAASPPPSSFQPILDMLINDLSGRAQPLVLILEDYHAISAAEIQASLAYLLQHLRDRLHLLLVTRTEPELPLGILRARDELVEINASDLRFTAEETATFLQAAVPEPLPGAAVERLQERTEGWAAGLRLAALALQNKGGQDAARVIETFSGSHHYVADYLAHEVFDAQPEAFRSFLLCTCFLNRLNSELCDAVTGRQDGQAMLELLERQNLFLMRLSESRERGWYRYNPLFAETLQELARKQLGEAGIHTLFETASAWFEYQQMLDEAIEAALAAGLFERAITLVEKFVEIYSLGELHTLSRWVERIPPALTLQHASICLSYAQVLLFTLDRYAPATAARIEPYLDAAERAWRAQEQDEKVGMALALRGMMLIWQGQFQEALVCVHQSLDLMSENEVFWRGVSLLNAAAGDMNMGHMASAQGMVLEARAFLGASHNSYGLLAASSILAEIHYFQGDAEQVTRLTSQLMVEAVGDDSMLDDQAEARRILANTLYEQNELEAAERYLLEGLELARQRGNELLEALLQSRLAAIQIARGNEASARDGLMALAARLQSRSAQREVQEALAGLEIRAGRLENLGTWLGSVDTKNEDLLYSQRERQILNLARMRITSGHPSEALGLLEPLPTEAVRSKAQVCCVRALALHASGDTAAAGKVLLEALELGHEKGFRRLFVDEGLPLATVLRELAPGLSDRGLSLYAGALLRLLTSEAAALRPGEPVSGALIEPLSTQELRVLRLLAAGLSNGAIAGELVVSTNTVKTHVKSIYRKLDVGSRDEARLAAKELKLL